MVQRKQVSWQTSRRALWESEFVYTDYIPRSEIETDVQNSSAFSDADHKKNQQRIIFLQLSKHPCPPIPNKCQGCISQEHTILTILQRLEAPKDEDKLSPLSENLKSMTWCPNRLAALRRRLYQSPYFHSICIYYYTCCL